MLWLKVTISPVGCRDSVSFVVNPTKIVPETVGAGSGGVEVFIDHPSLYVVAILRAWVEQIRQLRITHSDRWLYEIRDGHAASGYLYAQDRGHTIGGMWPVQGEITEERAWVKFTWERLVPVPKIPHEVEEFCVHSGEVDKESLDIVRQQGGVDEHQS